MISVETARQLQAALKAHSAAAERLDRTTHEGNASQVSADYLISKRRLEEAEERARAEAG